MLARALPAHATPLCILSNTVCVSQCMYTNLACVPWRGMSCTAKMHRAGTRWHPVGSVMAVLGCCCDGRWPPSIVALAVSTALARCNIVCDTACFCGTQCGYACGVLCCQCSYYREVFGATFTLSDHAALHTMRWWRGFVEEADVPACTPTVLKVSLEQGC